MQTRHGDSGTRRNAWKELMSKRNPWTRNTREAQVNRGGIHSNRLAKTKPTSLIDRKQQFALHRELAKISPPRLRQVLPADSTSPKEAELA